MPAAETRIALANVGAFARGSVLLVGFEPDLARAVLDTPGVERVTVFDHDLRRHRACAVVEGVDARFGPWLDDAGAFDRAAVQMPKETERLRLLLAMVRSVVERSAIVALVGHNRAGVRSGPRYLREAIGEPDPIDYRAHCRMYAAGATAAPARASLEEWRQRYRVEVAGHAVDVVSYPGTFAHGRLDPGTRLLLEAAELPDGARVLDVGCGSGAIGAWLGTAARVRWVHAVDVDALAVRACGETFGANGVGGRVWASDVYSDVDAAYSAIVANAPFHAGIRTTSDVADRLIAGAPPRLEPGGVLWLVANRFLDYPARLDEAFGGHEVAAEDGRYRVYRARRAD